MKREEAIAEIQRAGFGPLTEKLCEHLQRSIKIVPTNGPIESNHSHFGGSAYLPHDTQWPCSDLHDHYVAEVKRLENDHKKNPATVTQYSLDYLQRKKNLRDAKMYPMECLASICLRDLGSYGEKIGLPADGVLNFFYAMEPHFWGFDPDHRRGWRVIYTPEGKGREVVSPPSYRPTLEKPVGFAHVWTLPDEWLLKILYKTNVNDGYTELRSLLNGDPGHDWRHRLGGWPDQVQGDMRWSCQLASNGVYCGDKIDLKDPVVAKLAESFGEYEWQLLLQLDTDENVKFANGSEWMWGDSGTLYFWITQTALREKNFDNVWCILQCH